MHDEGTRDQLPARSAGVTVELGHGGVAVTAPDSGQGRPSPAEHREDVVRRLVRRGLSPRLLRSLLPEFRPLIDRLHPR